MSLVWRKIQRSNKKAAKFRFVAQFQELNIQCTKKWQPTKVAVSWVHRRRRYVTKDHKWEPTITDPYRGLIVWPPSSAETLEMTTTLYKDSRNESFDDKEWTFIVEETTSRGKRKPIAGVNLNMRLFINELPGTQTELKLKLKPMCEHLVSCQMQLILSCIMVKEGDANDDDMKSMSSMLSSVRNSNQQHDIGNLAEIEDEFIGSSDSLGSGTGTPNKSPGTDTEIFQKIAEVATKIDALNDFDEPYSFRKPEPKGHIEPKLMETPKQEFRKSTERDSTRFSTSTPKVPPNDSGITDSMQKSSSGVIDDSQNTSQDLLSWCQSMTKSYKRVKIIDFSTSWRNGLGFCAIIHKFRPDLLDFDMLNQSNIRENCQLAFDIAAKLGVPKLIDPSDMVIMAIPDKIAIMTYVYMLRSHFTGQPMPDDHMSPRPYDTLNSNGDSQVVFRGGVPENHESRKSARDSNTGGIFQKMKTRKSGSGTSSERSSKPGSPAPPEHLSLTLSHENIQKPKLMTRNQLMNPFDSDDDTIAHKGPVDQKVPEDHKGITVADSRSPTTSSPKVTLVPVVTPSSTLSNIPAVSVTPTVAPPTSVVTVAPIASPITVSPTGETLPRQEALKRRARELLDQYPLDRERTPDDDERRKDLRERARKLIEDVKTQSKESKVVKISDTLPEHRTRVPEHQANSYSAPTTRHVTPEHSVTTFTLTKLRPIVHEDLKLAKISENINFYQMGTHNSGPTSSSPTVTKASLLSQTSRTRRAYPASSTKSDVQGAEGAFDRFKRFGSMRGQELAQSINILSNRLTQTVRSSSEPKEISLSHMMSARDGSMERESSPMKMQTSLELDLRSHDQLLAEMEEVARQQQELNRKATEVEKRWRHVMQEASGSEEEQKLMNEYLALLNERNMLTRREMHLSLLENIADYESRFQLVQKDLGELIQIEDSEKTELHKQQIDHLMEELISIVNKRDELMQQLLAHEQGTEEDAELANDVMAQSNLLPQQEKENCCIQ